MKSYDIDKELRFLRPLKYKKYTNRRRVIINFIFNISMVFAKPRKGIKIKKFKIKGYQNTKIKIYVLKHKIEALNKKALLYLHGGGFQVEGTPVHIRMISNMIYDSGHTAVYVKYRLAPKYPFPYGLEDSYAAYLWMCEHEDLLNVQKEEISIAGDSAGGNLAIGVSLLVRDRLKRKLQSMLLFYPVIDHRQITPSINEFDDTPMWNSILNKSMWETYLRNGDFGMLRYTSFLTSDLNDLPKTYIETAEFDCLRDEGMWFANRLKEFNIPVVERHTKGSVHGYDAVFFSDFVKQRVKDRSDFLILGVAHEDN